jgi:hypothetical protein
MIMPEDDAGILLEFAENIKDGPMRDQAYLQAVRRCVENGDESNARKARALINESSRQNQADRYLEKLGSQDANNKEKSDPLKAIQTHTWRCERFLRNRNEAEARKEALAAYGVAQELLKKVRGSRGLTYFMPLEAVAISLAGAGEDEKALDLVSKINAAKQGPHSSAEVVVLIRLGRTEEAVTIMTTSKDPWVGGRVMKVVRYLAALSHKAEVETLAATGRRPFDQALLYLEAAQGVAEAQPLK